MRKHTQSATCVFVSMTFCAVILLVSGGARGTGVPDLSWFSVDGGGGSSEDVGGLEVSGTIGQPDAGVSSSGTLTLEGGFWGRSVVPTSLPEAEITEPPVFRLRSASPNPLTASTNVAFSIPVRSHVRLDVFDVSGRRVITLVDENLRAGDHEVTWRGRDADGRDVGSGTYFLQLVVGTRVARGKMSVVR